jgi:hypothetical protein
MVECETYCKINLQLRITNNLKLIAIQPDTHSKSKITIANQWEVPKGHKSRVIIFNLWSAYNNNKSILLRPSHRRDEMNVFRLLLPTYLIFFPPRSSHTSHHHSFNSHVMIYILLNTPKRDFFFVNVSGTHTNFYFFCLRRRITHHTEISLRPHESELW